MTSFVNLDTTQYVRINVAYKSMILQAHRDAVRITVSDTKPAKSNEAFHLLSGADAPLPLNIVNTNVWALAVSDRSSLIVTESTTSFATEETVSQLVMDISNAIDETAYDLNAASFSETTNITKDYILDNVEMNFTTTSSRDIIITTSDGTIIFEDINNIDKSLVWAGIDLGLSANENITIDITQTVGACSADVILRIKSGTNTLLGNPAVQWVDTEGTIRGFKNAGGRPRVSTTTYTQEISKGNLANHVHLWGFGERSEVQVDTKGEDIWLGPTARMTHPLTAGEGMTVVSSDAQDGVAGTGVLTIKIEYIDGSGLAQTEDLILNGTSGVNTIATDIAFINHMYATSVGSNGVAEGNIDIHKLGDAATVYGRISTGGNKDLSIHLRIPIDKTYFITEWHCSVTGNKPTAVRLRSTDWGNVLYNGDDSVFIFKDTAYLAEGNFDRDFDPPIRVPGGSTIKVSAWAQQAGGFTSASFNGFYE